MTRGQRQVSKSGTTLSWMEGGVCLDKDVLREEQLKDPAYVDTLCWIRPGSRPGKDEIPSSGLDQKFLWSNYKYLVIQDGLLCKHVGPLAEA